MEFPRFWKVSKPVSTESKSRLTPSILVRDTRGEDVQAKSSQVNDSLIWLVRPDVQFSTAYDHFKTSGKFFNSVESYVTEFLSRDWSFDGSAAGVAAMEAWEELYAMSRFAETYARDMLVTGNFLCGISDWQPVPITNIEGCKRDQYGNIQEYWYRGANNQLKLMGTPKEFLHDRYISISRNAWGYGMAHALMSTYVDEDGDTSKSALDIDKQITQDFAKIYHKYASPRTFMYIDDPNYNPDDYNPDNPNSMAGRFKAMKAGDRVLFPKKVEITTEGVDPQARFVDGIDAIIDPEINAGLQNSANRVLTDPSAMADARVASDKDDARLLGLMEKFRRFMNNEIIPRVTQSKVEFKWGSKDDFDFDPLLAMQLLQAGVIGKSELRKMIEDIGMPLDDALYQKDQEEKQQQQADMFAMKQGGQEKPSPNNDGTNPTNDNNPTNDRANP